MPRVKVIRAFNSNGAYQTIWPGYERAYCVFVSQSDYHELRNANLLVDKFWDTLNRAGIPKVEALELVHQKQEKYGWFFVFAEKSEEITKLMGVDPKWLGTNYSI